MLALPLAACNQPTEPAPRKTECTHFMRDSANVKFVALIERRQRTDTMVIP